jgi:hypothetical protein
LPITKFEGASRYKVRRRRSISSTHADDGSSTNEIVQTDGPSRERNGSDSTSLTGEAFAGFDEVFEDDFFNEKHSSAETETERGSGRSSSRTNYVDPNDVEFDPSLSYPEEIYCSIINNLDEACWEVNPAELWSFNRSLIDNLTQEDIIRVINHQFTR